MSNQHQIEGFAQGKPESGVINEKNMNVEKELLEKNLLFKTALEISPVIVAKANINMGYFVDVSSLVTKILGYSVEEFISKPIMEFIHPDDRKKTNDKIADQIQGKKVIFFENRYLHKDGNYRWMAWQGTPADNQGIVTAVGSDITKHKKAEMELSESKEKFKSLFDCSPDLIALIDLNGNIVDINRVDPRYEKKEVINTNLADFLSPDDKKELHGAMARAAATGEPQFYEPKIITPGGEEVYWYNRVSPIRKNGVATGFVFSFTDVTERKQAEKARDESEKRFRHAFESANDGVALVGLNGEIIRVNKRLCDYFGYDKNKLEGMNVNDLTHPEDKDISPMFFQRSQAGEIQSAVFEKRYYHKNGKIVWGQVSVAGVNNSEGKPEYYISHVRNITDKKKAEQSWRLAQQMAKIGSWSYNIETDESIWSEQMYHVFGCDPDKGTPDYESHKKLFHPEDWEMFDKAVKRGMNGSPYDIEARLLFPDGSLHWCHAQGFPRYNQNGEIVELFGTTQDITDRKKAEKDYENLVGQLYQSEKMSAIGQLAAGVAHEINNPIGYISSNLNTLNKYRNELNTLIGHYKSLITHIKETPHLDTSVSELLETINTAEEKIDLDYVLDDFKNLISETTDGTERVKKIVMDLKDFAHPGNERRMRIDVNKGIESTLNVAWNELKYKAKVIKKLGELPTIKGHPQQLNQVFMNILVNAAQAIEEKGEIIIKTQYTKGVVEISIADTGLGIPKENLVKIYDPFFTTKDVGKGTGMGLNISYNIIKQHNGTIDVRSKPGAGTTFIIKLPVEVGGE